MTKKKRFLAEYEAGQGSAFYYIWALCMADVLTKYPGFTGVSATLPRAWMYDEGWKGISEADIDDPPTDPFLKKMQKPDDDLGIILPSEQISTDENSQAEEEITSERQKYLAIHKEGETLACYFIWAYNVPEVVVKYPGFTNVLLYEEGMLPAEDYERVPEIDTEDEPENRFLKQMSTSE